MRPGGAFQLVFVTAPNLKQARLLARAALKAGLVACANIIPAIESHYWWQGEIEMGREAMIVFKTRRSHVAALEALVLTLHPYDTPEILAISVSNGNPKYLRWISASLRAVDPSHPLPFRKKTRQ